MRSAKIVTVAIVLAIAVLGSTAFINEKLLSKANADNKGFAVIELFTSEGCSSCPPADDLVAKIERESTGKPVYILVYHVDYWNSGAWKDAFSSADYSKRQRDYARCLHLSQIYTPQIVVNGKTEFVGSDEGTLRNAIKTNLQQPQGTPLNLTVTAIGQGQAMIKYTTGSTDKNTALFIAVLQKSAQTKVGGGENGGRTLSHVQIVRKLQKVSLNGSGGETKVALPKGFDTQNWEIMGFLQNTVDGAVTGAAGATFSAGVNVSVSVPKNSK